MFTNREKYFVFLLAVLFLIGALLNFVRINGRKNNLNRLDSIDQTGLQNFDSLSAELLTIPESEFNRISTKKFDLNHITRIELESISGIGPVLAKRILDYRTNIGKFKEIDELLKVKGIGVKKLEKVREFLFISQ